MPDHDYVSDMFREEMEVNSNLTESTLAEMLIDYNGIHSKWRKTEFIPEVHYSYYGNRGSVDLFGRCGHGLRDYVVELKSDYAIQQSTGANQIIRQFNKHQKYFYKGTDYDKNNPVEYHLIFAGTKKSFEHIFNNVEMYKSIVEQNQYISIYSPQDNKTCRLFTPTIDATNPPNNPQFGHTEYFSQWVQFETPQLKSELHLSIESIDDQIHS